MPEPTPNDYTDYPEGKNKHGQLDNNRAWEVAHAEKALQDQAAKVRKDVFAKEMTGMTEDEKQYLSLVEQLSVPEKYPKAFVKQNASDGTPVFITHSISYEVFSSVEKPTAGDLKSVTMCYRFAISPDGIARITIPQVSRDTLITETKYDIGNDTINRISADNLQKLISMAKQTDIVVRGPRSEQIHEDHYVSRLGLTDIAKNGQAYELFKSTLFYANKESINTVAKVEAAAQAIKIENIVADL